MGRKSKREAFFKKGDLVYLPLSDNDPSLLAVVDKGGWEKIVDKGLDKFHWVLHVPNKKPGGPIYARICRIIDYSRSYYYLHRIITEERWRKVDHIDGDGLNNIESNLRDGSVINERNATVTSRNSSGYKGVFLCSNGNTWTATTTSYGKSFRKEGYRSPEAAARARDEFVRRNYPDGSIFNFPRKGERGLDRKIKP